MAGFGETIREFGVQISLAFDRQKVDLVQSKIEKLGAEMRHFSLEVTAAAAAIFEFGNLASSNARDLQQNSDLLGINVENLQELAYAAKVAAGVSRDELVGALESVSDVMDKARHGDVMASEGLLRLAQAGVGTEKMLELLRNKGTTSEQVMMALSESFKNLKDPLAAARLATEAFGGAGAKLLPFLRKGPEGIAALRKEGRALGVIIPKNTIDQAAEMDRQFTKMWEVFKSISYTIGFEVLKYLKPLVQEFMVWTQHNKKLIASGIVTVIKELAHGIMLVLKFIREMMPYVSAAIEKLGGLEQVMKDLVAIFLIFKAITFATATLSFFSSLWSLVSMLLPAFTTLVGVFEGLGAAFGALGEITALAEVVPALAAIGPAILAAVSPLLPFVAGLAAAAVAIHDIWALLHDQPTWTGAAVGKVSEWGAKAKGWWDKNVGGSGGVPTSGVPSFATAGAGSGAGTIVNQQYVNNSNVSLEMPKDTTAPEAAGLASKAISDAHDKNMRKTKTDAVRRRKS